MSEFLIIVPAGWTQLDWEFVSNHGLDANAINNAYVSATLEAIEAPLKDMGLIALDATVLDAKLFDNAFFMVRLG